jgi:hypothetical protein
MNMQKYHKYKGRDNKLGQSIEQRSNINVYTRGGQLLKNGEFF